MKENQIERKRQHPKKRHRREVGGDIGRHAEQQARRREREKLIERRRGELGPGSLAASEPAASSTADESARVMAALSRVKPQSSTTTKNPT